ncbi:MAG: phage tail sheath family protein [Chloroflexi bacterium]|nr:phage tail sheath family protein [Chloroflexota bacterium]
MPEYLSPGVYVEEVDRGPKPIEGVGTAMAAFVGFTEKAEMKREIDGEVVVEDLLNKPQLVTNWSQYVERYGEFVPGAFLSHAVYGYFMNGGTRCYVVSVRTIPRAQAMLVNSAGKPSMLVKAKQAGFEGLRLRVKVEDVKALPEPAPKATAKKPDSKEGDDAPDTTADEGGDSTFTVVVERAGVSGGWRVEEVLDGVTLQEIKADGRPEIKVAYKNDRPSKWVDILVTESGPLSKVWPREQEQALGIEAAQLPAPSTAEFQGKVTERSGVEGLEALDDVTMVCVPDLMTPMPGQKADLDTIKAVQTMMIAHCERMGDRVAVLDCPPDMSPQEIKKWRMDTAGYDSSYAALYYPWIQVMDPATNRPISIPPSGHMAGVWARNDSTRGVHKAPANEVVQGVVGLAYQTTKGEQDTLNPVGINCIRAFPGRGIRVWGARTLSSNPSWRYINVRRLFNFVEKSIEGGTQWVVFEPNDRKLWARVRRDISAFLKVVWRTGALFGSTPAEAFYVKCDDELNPPETRDLGQLIIEIGLAPVKPAEFVIFRISQWAGPGAE